jgi:DNA-binding NarL/FixJ family response regulator
LLEGQSHWEVFGEDVNGREAVSMCQDMKPNIAILDISMPELNGVDASKQILNVSPATEILIFTMHDSDQLVRDMLVAGVRGYLLKSDPAHNVIDALASLAIHRPYFNMRVNETILTGYLSAVVRFAVRNHIVEF